MTHRLLTAVAALLLAGAAAAQTAALPPPQNVLQLTASGTVEAPQDLLTLTLTTTREGPDANAVQTQLKAALDAALAEARRTASSGEMDVRTGNFFIHPRHNREGRIGGWSGTAELVLEGRDFPRITQAAARVQSMTIGGVNFGLSREARQRLESQAQSQAIERFQARAAELARSFGFSGYTLREVAVHSNDQGFGPRPPRPMAMERATVADAALPVEAGKAAVVVTVSGSVQMR